MIYRFNALDWYSQPKQWTPTMNLSSTQSAYLEGWGRAFGGAEYVNPYEGGTEEYTWWRVGWVQGNNDAGHTKPIPE